VKLTAAIGLPGFPAGALTGERAGDSSGAGSGSGSGDNSGAGSDTGTVLPAVLSPQLAAQLGNRTTSVSTGLGPVTIRTAAVVSTTPAVPGDQFVILSAARLAALHPSAAAYPQATAPTTVLAMNAPGRRIDGAALRAAARDSTTSATVLLLTQQRAALADTPLQHGARRIYLAAVVAGALYSALAMLLSLLQAAPGRKTLLARLRTMGMTRRQSRRLVLLEMLPQALLAAVGGALVGLAVIPLLGPGIDLRALAFGTGPRDLAPVDFGLGLRADPWSLVLPSAALLVLACAVLLTQAWLTARRQESTELRAGDQA
jgi:putative ABC transport system permease protein